MILHLVSDHFVTNTCLKVFTEELPDKNIVLVFNYFGYNVKDGIVVTKENSCKVAEAIDFSTVSHVLVAFLSRAKLQFLKDHVPTNIPVIWWTYGADLYTAFLYKRGLNFFYSDPDRYSTAGVFAYPMIKFLRLIKNRYYNRTYYNVIIDRMTGFVPCIRPEYDLLRKNIKKEFDLIQIHPYGASYRFNGKFTFGKDIAVGHSASISDNHLYALKYLKRLNLKDSELYLTLSYSNKVPRYTKRVDRKFKRKFKDKVHFIYDLMPKQEYIQSQFKYKMMILPSWRQEALDNIYTCLQIGIKLVLSEKSVVYEYLKQFGFIVYSIESLTQHDLDNPLEHHEKTHNQKLFEKFYLERKDNFYNDFNRIFKNTSAKS